MVSAMSSAIHGKSKKDLRLEIIKLSSSLGRDSDDQSHPINDEHTKRMIGNLKYFITYEIPGICSRTFDLDVLKSSSVQVLPAGGSTSQDFFLIIVPGH